MLWASRTLQSPNMLIPKEHLLHQCLHQPAGLKTLVYSSPGEPLVSQSPSHHSSIITNSHKLLSQSSSLTTPSLLPSNLTCSSSWSSAMDDLIGTESGVCMNSDEEQTLQVDKSEAIDHSHKFGKRRQRCSMSREYPPPIPLQARTGNLPGHMPWVLTRHYTDGKLILKEERVMHHQYFEAYRENGRLILNLVFLDDTVTSNNEELELEDLEFMKEEQEIDGYTHNGEEKPEEYEESVQADSNNMDNIREVEETTHKGGSIMIMNSQMPKTNLENGVERVSLVATYFSHSGSAPLALPVRPLTAVM
ncbi:hypothetical protein Patl1_08470 [Pistacia atlantica]|uniref:Uncharacterized protein n=1 Tax=Pistacia atlantica TaxID=434234 RepID=A0ACC1AIA2_9ROSI|nr:hypothetical protein Patl1_08470 [Pistacia atlantica]